MFTLIESKDEITKFQRKLESTIRRDFRQSGIRNIGHPGGAIIDASIFTDGTYWYRRCDYNHKEVQSPRYLNWFGLFKAGGSLQISVEINIPCEGRNDRVAGFFARDNNTGKVYLLHSGGIGGGTKGVGKYGFLAWSGQRLTVAVDSSGRHREGILIMPVEGLAASRSAVKYIDTVVDFKSAVRTGVLETREFQRKKMEFEDFYSEARGRRKGHRSSEIDYLSRHGEVVDALRNWRKSKSLPKGGRVVKNVLIDMGVAVGKGLVEVFEVKTSTGRSDIYGAIGQLMVHGAVVGCRRVIVVPNKNTIAADMKAALDRLGIELLRFELDEKKAVII